MYMTSTFYHFLHFNFGKKWEPIVGRGMGRRNRNVRQEDPRRGSANGDRIEGTGYI
jgi:hypothetical protein